MKKILCWAFAILSALFVPEKAQAGLVVGGGNVVVYQVTGTGALSSAGTQITLNEYDGSNGTLVQSFSFDTSGTNRLVASGSATSEGKIKYYNGFLAVTGYDANSGTASVNGTASATTARSVAVINVGNASTSYTRLSDAYNTNNIRSAISDGTNIWTAGTGSGATPNPGIRHATVGATTSTQLNSAAPTNTRTVNIADGQLYMSHNSGTGVGRIMTVGTGLPTTTGQTLNALPGIPNNIDSYDFFFADLDGNVGIDTLFSAVGQTVQKFSLVSGNWISDGTISLGASVFGLSGIQTGSNVRFFANTELFVRGFDLTSGFNVPFTATANWTTNAAANTAFRGLAAVPEPTAMLMVGMAMVGCVVRRRRIG